MFSASVFLQDAESTVLYRECSPFFSLGHSAAKEKAILLSIQFVHKVAPIGPGLTPVASPVEKPRGQFDSLSWYFSEGQML